MHRWMTFVWMLGIATSCKDGGSTSTAHQAPRAALDARAASEALAALGAVVEDQRGMMAARALAELQKDRLPTGAIASLQKATPSQESDSKLLAAELEQAEIAALVEGVCGAPLRAVLEPLAAQTPSERAAHVWEACNLGRVKLLEPAEALTRDALPLLYAHALAWHIDQTGGLADQELELFAILTEL